MLRTFTDLVHIAAFVGMVMVWPSWLQAQDEARLFDVVVRGNALPGYYLMAPTNNALLGLVDHGGWVLHRSPARSPLNLQRHVDGTYTYFVPLVGHIRMDSTFTTAIDTLQASVGGTDFHECKVLPNGNYLLLAALPRKVDMSRLVQGGFDTATVLDAVIEEQEPDGDVIWRWNSKDHTSILDVTRGIDLKAPSIDYIHVNSLHKDADGNILISMRNFDEIGKIDRATGSFIWRLGGSESKNNQFTWQNDTIDGFRGFSRQHSVVRTAADRILIMDNGGLKPTEYSRAVEYQIDEQAKTVRRVWQYRPTPDIVARVMGSVERLSNGGTLIGWGQNVSRMALTELDSSGNVVYELKNAQGVNVSSYRVGKHPLKMIADRRRLSSPGTYEFRSAGSATGFTARVAHIAAPRTITIEQHLQAPFDRQDANIPPVEVDPVRWTVRHDIASADSVEMLLRLADVPAVRDARRAMVWHRPLDGSGGLTRLAGSFTNGSWTFNALRAGEYMVGYMVGTIPTPLMPDSGAVRVDPQEPLRWSHAIAADSFTVQIDTLASFIGSPRTRTTTDTSWSASDLRGSQTYWWRVRAWRNGVGGPWSRTMRFRTTLRRPSLILPVADVVLEPEHVTVTWTRVQGAATYHVRVSDGVRVWQQRVSDTTVVFEDLTGDSVLTFSVTSESISDTSLPMSPLSAPSLPHRPLILAPLPGAMEVADRGTVLRWLRPSGSASHVRCMSFSASTLVADDTVTSMDVSLPDLERGRIYTWQARSMGRKGASQWTRQRWFTTAGDVVHSAPVLRAPADQAILETGIVELEWESGINLATAFVQIAMDTTFADPLVDTAVVGANRLAVRALPTDRMLYWRVSETKSGQAGSWSGVWRFMITGRGLGPVYPPNGSMNVPTIGEVVYTTHSRFREYRVEFFVEGNVTAPDHLFASQTDRCRYLGLYPATWYTWRVAGVTNDGEVEVGAASRFRTTPSLSVPDNRRQTTLTYIHGTIEATGEVNQTDACILIDVLGRTHRCQGMLISDEIVRYSVPPEVRSGMYMVVLLDGAKARASAPVLVIGR